MNRKQRRAAEAAGRKQGVGYASRLFAGMDSLPLTGVALTTVQHDSWCDKLNGRGACNCNPDVTRRIAGTDEIQTVSLDGRVMRHRAN